MTFNITIDHSSPHDSDRSSLSDEEDSSGVQVSPPSIAGSHDYHDPYDVGSDWAHLPYPDELKPSDSASRPRTHAFHGSRSASRRRNPRRREIMHERESYSHRTRRHHSPPPPASPESVDSADEYVGGYPHAPQERRYWPPVAHAPPPGYAHSSSSGPSYTPYNQSAVPHGAYPFPAGPHPPSASDQLVRLGHLGGHAPQYGGSPPYGYGSQFPHIHNPAMPPYFGHEHHADHLGHHVHRPPPHSHHSHHQAAHPRGRRRAHSPPEHAMSHTVPPPGAATYGAPPFSPSFSPSEMVPYGHPGYLQYNNPYPVVPGMPPQPPSYFNPYPRVSPPPRVATTPSATSEADTAKDEAIARLEKLILDERMEREAREAARLEAIEREAAERAAKEERAAAEKRIADEAAAKAAAEAKAEAEKKAAEEADKAKKAAEEAAAAAAAEAAAAATEAANAAAEERIAAAAAAASAAANQPPPEKKKPIKFKDAVGRKFSFPFHLCCTWQGMEELIRQAFLHVEVIGPHVAEGHYDLVGPNGDIILPQVWETVVEPDWTITMHMWPIPEKPKTPEPPPPPPPPPEPVADDNAIVTVVEEPKRAESAGAKKQRAKAPDPGAFAMWMVGGTRARAIKSLKAAKKPEVL